MFVLAEKIEPPRRQQVFTDYAAEDAALKRREDDDRWIKRIIEALAGTLRKIRN